MRKEDNSSSKLDEIEEGKEHNKEEWIGGMKEGRERSIQRRPEGKGRERDRK